MDNYHILVPIDYSECAEAALAYALSIASTRESVKLSLLHVDPGIVPYYDENLGILDPSRWFEHLRSGSVLQAARFDFPVHELVVYGEPAAEILKLANDGSVDLIVMGTHGRTGLDRLVVGSVSSAVLRNAPCPVTVVKAALPTAEKNGAAQNAPVAKSNKQDGG